MKLISSNLRCLPTAVGYAAAGSVRLLAEGAGPDPSPLAEAALAATVRHHKILIRLIARRGQARHVVDHAGIGRGDGQDAREDQRNMDWHGTAS